MKETLYYTVIKAHTAGLYNIICRSCNFLSKYDIKAKDLYTAMRDITDLFNNEYNKAVLFEIE